MKRLILLLVLFLGFTAPYSYGAFMDSDTINASSFTATSESQVSISSNVLRSGNVFVGVVVSSPSNGSVKFYDAFNAAAGVALSTIGIVNFMSGNSNNGYGYTQFMVRLSSGLAYTITGTNPGITIIYKLSNPRQ